MTKNGESNVFKRVKNQKLHANKRYHIKFLKGNKHLIGENNSKKQQSSMF